MPIAQNFGVFFKEKRRKLGLTLREFCRVNKLDPGNISKIERGLLPPPKSKEILIKYASALGINEGTDDWLIFCDLATVSAGKIPPDIVSNEQLMNALPVLFRTARGRNLSEEDLKNLVGSIKQELS
ncbi:MAG: helix-turn-helix domain-containing protein [Deltaproteobacteria bacterium]|nr:helix-turn-helix domain-containing protein [Deltaproteobacteria bacterium]